MHKKAVCGALGILAVASALVYVWTGSSGPDIATQDTLGKPGIQVLEEESGRDAGSTQSGARRVAVSAVHPLLKEADAAVLAEGTDQILSTAADEIATVIRAVARSVINLDDPASLTIDYPHHQTIFPPDMGPPTFLWHDSVDEADTWLVEVTFQSDSNPVYVLLPGNPPPAGPIDPECIAKSNEIYQPTPYQASARSWTPGGDLWTVIKERSVGLSGTLTILGFNSAEPAKALSRGRITIGTSKDPVGAPIFYRDVPLAPAQTKEGVIKPLDDAVVTLIAWRLRDISQPESRLLLTDVPRCTNCHSFSADGKTLGMDLDGPQAGKGAYIIAPTTEHMAIDKEDVINWNSFPDRPEGHDSIGFLSQISPDGQHAVTTLNEEVYVCNFLDYRFLQVFYPTRGILAYYSRETGQIEALPGADDPEYVQCDAVWSPKGDYLVFARAKAKDAYPQNKKLAQRANDPLETPIQYDLYRIPFNGGRGGEPEAIVGASNNGISNTFPKVSPDGKWIVFVKCRNGQLMRPDSKLWIVPAGGGTARLMQCNTWRMNSWHSFSPNGRWLVFSSKANTPYTEMFLTHIDNEGSDSPAILIPNSTAANRAVNIPEFLNLPYDGLLSITMPAVDYRKYLVRGAAKVKQGKLDEAIAEFDMAVKIKSDCLEGRVNAAVVLIDMGELDEAKDRLNKVLELDPNYGEAHVGLGVILGKRRMLDEAMAHFETALKIDPDNSAAHVNLAKALQAKGMLEEATDHFRTALDLDAEDPLGHFLLANVLLARGMLKEAVENLEKAVEIDPRFVNAHIMLGNVLAANGTFGEAAGRFQRALDVDPNNLTAVNALAWLLASCPSDDVRDGARALQLIEPACAGNGYRDPVLLSTLAAAYAEVGEFPKAVVTANKAQGRVNPRDRALAQRIRRQLDHYLSGKPYRASPNRPPS